MQRKKTMKRNNIEKLKSRTYKLDYFTRNEIKKLRKRLRKTLRKLKASTI